MQVHGRARPCPSRPWNTLVCAVADAGVGAVLRGSLTAVISTSDPDDRAGALATFFTAGYTGVSLPVVGVGLVLQHLSPQVTLLVFALAAALGILAAPVLVRPTKRPAAVPSLRRTRVR
ncbi:hypothetical protein [Actinomadura sp. NPDC049753]|uniref:hypothetical protein n=1 Tax=Actinomadura sp. NPDC049753 TaxID=3154739 RepID=UPI0034229CAE